MSNTKEKRAMSTAQELHGHWLAAYRRLGYNDSDAAIRREQAAHDALVDHIEAHDLNGCRFDPRGPIAKGWT